MERHGDAWIVKLLASDNAVSILNDIDEIRAVPNPFEDQFKLVGSENLIGMNYLISDLVGKRIDEGKIDTNQNIVLGKTLNPGTYNLIIENGSTLRIMKE